MALESLPTFRVDVCLVENAAQGTNGYLEFSRDNRDIYCDIRTANELDVASLLRGLDEPRGFKTTLDFAVRQGAKPRQPQPRWSLPTAGGLPAAARSKVPALL